MNNTNQMFCYQCQETAKGTGCTLKGVCGKQAETANLQDVLIYTAKGVAYLSDILFKNNISDSATNLFMLESLFTTITNANFDDNAIITKVKEGLSLKDKALSIIKENGLDLPADAPEAIAWNPSTDAEITAKNNNIGIEATVNEDIRSLKELLTYGIKGIAAYAHHAHTLDYENEDIYKFIAKGLSATLSETISADELVAIIMECGQCGVSTMALLDQANTETYGNPEITQVNIGTRNNPAILISGHDLKDMEELLKQTENTGVDVYTHSEMLPANYYPAFKKYTHFAGNYGSAWWNQTKDFETFNGPVLFTTNCIVPPKESYADRIYTTGCAGFKGVVHIPDRTAGGTKDFSAIIEHAKKCPAPTEIETGFITGGFAHNAVLSLADKVVDAVKSGAIKKFIVMAGCDGRMKSRSYYTEFAEALPKDTVILTAGCAKYRYNKLNLGDIGGIPRVLDAGQCNDSYSLAVIAMKLQEVFGLDDINDLPIVYNIAWYEQKAVIVLLALLSLGVKNIHLGPTLPGFLSPNVAKILIDTFNIGGVTDVASDIKSMIG